MKLTGVQDRDIGKLLKKYFSYQKNGEDPSSIETRMRLIDFLLYETHCLKNPQGEQGFIEDFNIPFSLDSVWNSKREHSVKQVLEKWFSWDRVSREELSEYSFKPGEVELSHELLIRKRFIKYLENEIRNLDASSAAFREKIDRTWKKCQQKLLDEIYKAVDEFYRQKCNSVLEKVVSKKIPGYFTK